MDSATRKRKAPNNATDPSSTDGSASKKIKLLVRRSLFSLGLTRSRAYLPSVGSYGRSVGRRGGLKRRQEELLLKKSSSARWRDIKSDGLAQASTSVTRCRPRPSSLQALTLAFSSTTDMMRLPAELVRRAQVERARYRVQNYQSAQECFGQEVSIAPQCSSGHSKKHTLTPYQRPPHRHRVH